MKKGTHITPDDKLFDVEEYASVTHASDFMIPFFRNNIHSKKEEIPFYDKKNN